MIAIRKQVTYCTSLFYGPNSSSPGWQRLLHVLWGAQLRENHKNNNNKKKIRHFPYSILLREESKLCNFMILGLPPSCSLWISEQRPFKICFHAVLQAPPVTAARFNKSHDSLLGPSREILKRLFRAAFYTVSKLVPRE